MRTFVLVFFASTLSGATRALSTAADIAISRLSDGRPLYASETSAWPGGPAVHLSDDAGVLLSTSLRALPPSTSALCVVDGRAVLRGECALDGSCSCRVDGAAGAGLHSVAVYAAGKGNKTARLLGGGPVYVHFAHGLRSPGALAADAALRAHTPPGSGRLGVYYELATVDAQMYQNASRVFHLEASVTGEDVIRAGAFLNSSIWAYQAAAAAPQWATPPSAVYGAAPAIGIYCQYRKRANETTGAMPDCNETDAVWRTHAALLTAAGVEWVAPDSTNDDGDPRYAPPAGGSDLSILRPMELMADSWVRLMCVEERSGGGFFELHLVLACSAQAAMRAGGEATPQISVFARVSGGPLWRWFLDGFFNNETLLDAGLILRASPNGTSGSKVFFGAGRPGEEAGFHSWNATTVAAIEFNGGREDVVVPAMWFAPNATSGWEASGGLDYYAPCIAGGAYSTDAPFVIGGPPCGHLKTRNSSVGAVWTVSASVPQASQPYAGHKLGGAFLKRQFWDVFADPEPTDFLFAPSWNEFATGGGPVSEPNTLFTALGLRPDDPASFLSFVDAYAGEWSNFARLTTRFVRLAFASLHRPLAGEHSRTLEPSATDGGRYYALLASCMRVLRVQRALGIIGDGRGCAVAGEDCCETYANETFTVAFSLDAPGRATRAAPDSVVTSDRALAATLQAAGWAQVCSPDPTAFDGQTTVVVGVARGAGVV